MLENLESIRDYSLLARMVKAAGLDGMLNRPGAYTIFAPADAAFRMYPRETLGALLADRAKLAELLEYHVVPGKLTYSDLAKVSAVRTAGRMTLPVGRQGDAITIGGARVLGKGIDGRNGIIYRVENLIARPGFVMPQPRKARRAGRSRLRTLISVITLGGVALFLMSRKKGHIAPEPPVRLPEARIEESPTAGMIHAEVVKPPAPRAPGVEVKRKTVEISPPEELPGKVRASISVYRKPPGADIAKRMSLPLSGNANKGMAMLVKKGSFLDKPDFIRFLAKVYRENGVDSMMSEGIEPHESRVMDMIHESGIARGFFDTDIKKYLVPLFLAGFDAIHDFTTRKKVTESM